MNRGTGSRGVGAGDEGWDSYRCLPQLVLKIEIGGDDDGIIGVATLHKWQQSAEEYGINLQHGHFDFLAATPALASRRRKQQRRR